MDKKAESIFETAEWISSYLLGNISEAEEEKLKLWLEESGHHQEVFDALCGEVVDSKRIALYMDHAPEKAYGLFLTRKLAWEKRRQMKKWLSYAAILLLPWCIGGCLWWHFSKEVSRSEAVYRAEMLTEHLPVITLSNGEKVVLKQSALTLEDTRGVKVAEVDSNGLIYSGQPAFSEVPEYHILRTPAQCDYSFLLSDGTKVWANAKTTVKYPVVFGQNERVIQVKGEVYLEVVKDTARPFYVVTDDLKVKVLGTTFDVKSYHNDLFTMVTLVEGKVVAETGNRLYTLFPDHQLCFERANGQVTLSKVDAEDFVAWRTGAYVFNGQILEEVCRVLQRWYDVEILFEHPDYAQRIYTGIVFKEEKIEDFVRNLNTTSGYHCRYEHGKLYIR